VRSKKNKEKGHSKTEKGRRRQRGRFWRLKPEDEDEEDNEVDDKNEDST
jgi:hypothetical protein